MCRIRIWALVLATLALLPCDAWAGPFSFFQSQRDTNAKASATPNTSQAANAMEARNQRMAEQVAGALKSANLQGYNIQVEFKNGVAQLSGQIRDQRQLERATDVASRVAGVIKVQNNLRVLSRDSEKPPSEMPVLNAIPQSPEQKPVAEKRQFPSLQLPKFDILPAANEQPAARKSPEIQQVAAATALPTLHPQSPAPKKPQSKSNQEMAEAIAKSLKSAKLRGYDIKIRYESGVASLAGTVSTPEQIAKATEVVSKVPGVQRVDNRLGLIQQTAHTQPQFNGGHGHPPAGSPVPVEGGPRAVRPAMPSAMNPAMQYAHQGPMMMPPGYGPAMPMPVSYQPPPPAPAGPPGFNPYGGAPGVPAPPAYGHPGQGASHTVYNMPHLPDYAWPSYAAYPNSAQISYPQEYSASAWPYIGPFYPYPQVPLGWRKAQLEWDDGYWSLNFNPRTEKWFWFMNPKHW